MSWVNDLVSNSSASRHIAWAGEVEFGGCAEDDRTGRTVTLILRRPPVELASAHPFSAHTRRRKGFAGTQFEVNLQLVHGAGPIGMHSLMLLHWGASAKGETAKFLVGYDDPKHPFLACTRASAAGAGTRWMAAFIEVDGQSAAVDQRQRAAAESAMAPKKQEMKNSNLAHIFTKNPVFWQFIENTQGEHIGNQMEADGWLKMECNVSSKSELDSDSTAAARFTDLRMAFVDWQEAAGISTF